MPKPSAGASRRTVLIVDQSDDSRQVLRTVLERRGVEIYDTGHAGHGLQLARRHRPGVIVLDLEAVSAAGLSVHEGFAAESKTSQTPMVLLGSVRRAEPDLPSGSFVPKPYHYGPLIRKIESLLDSPGTPQNGAA